MPFPANLTTVTVVGSFITPEGTPSTGTVTFTASSWLTNSGANLSIPNSAVTKTLGTAGNFSATIPITDDADISPTGWVYTVAEVVDGVSRSYDVTIPGTVVAGGTVYLADLTPAAAAGPEYYSLASSLSIGTVSTLAAGSAATATITGLAPNQTLNLGIPTGATGATGAAATITVGTIGSTAYPGPGTVTNSGTSGAAVLNFVLVTGPTGATGATGATGPAASLGAVTPQALGVAAAGSSGTASREDHVHSSTVANPTFTGVVTTAAGTVSAPAISPTGDSNTGIFFPAADTVAIAEGGVEVLRVNSSGQIEHPAGSAAAPAIVPTGDTNTGLFAPAADTVAISTGGTERLRVNSSGNVGIGVSPGTDFDIQRDAQMQSRLRSAVTSTRASTIYFDKARGTWASPTTVASGDNTLEIYSRAHDGTQVRDIGAIQILVDGTVATNDVPSRLTLSTRPAGVAAAVTERMRIDSNGLITGTGTSLGAWTTWTPTYTGITLGNGTITARYCQIGKIIVARIVFTVGSTTTFAAATQISFSLPVTALNSDHAIGSGYGYDNSAGTGQMCVAYLNTTTTVKPRRYDTIEAFNDTVPWTWATSDQIRLNITYEAA